MTTKGENFQANRQKRTVDDRPPASVTRTWINLFGLASGIMVGYALLGSGLTVSDSVLIVMLATFLPMVLLDMVILKVHRRSSTGLDWMLPKLLNVRRVCIKLLGLGVVLIVLSVMYSLIPIYHSAFYAPVWQIFTNYAPILLPGLVLYFFWVDRYQRKPQDEYWLFGQLCLGKWSFLKNKQLKDFLRSWSIKGFFLPVMWASLISYFGTVSEALLNLAEPDLLHYFMIAWLMLFSIDLVFASAGYLFTVRVLDAHIRNTQSDWLGWLVALICYQPFSDYLHQLLDYQRSDFTWNEWLMDWPIIHGMWAIAIVLLLMIYVWATVSFGYRFSNLTHRGIITNGPYRYSKHPAYIAKNLSWWLIAVPFVPQYGFQSTLATCAMLLCVNSIYYLRARSEEKHLSQDTVYIEYSRWIEAHGLLGKLNLLRICAQRNIPIHASSSKVDATIQP